ncbi:MAG TPA: FtsX-like permease family protein [Burkholderiaceae bacterium]
MEIRPIFSALLRSKTAPLLVALQIAISLAVLANALYIVNLRVEAASRPSGIAEEANVFTLHAQPVKRPSHNELVAMQKQETALLRAIPGVKSVAWTWAMPMSRSGTSTGIAVSKNQTETNASAAMYFTPDSFVHTMGLKLLEGREFNAGEVVEVDANDAGNGDFPRSVIVTQALAKKLFPDATSYVGKTISFGTGADSSEPRIVGVVERFQAHHASARENGEFSVILPTRLTERFSRYAVRTEAGQRDRVMAQAEEAIRKASPVPLIISSRTTEQDRLERYRNEKSMAWMLAVVSVLLLMVTASGIVGMTVLRVSQRKKQIGIRRALGGRRANIVQYFLTENVMISTAGVVAGCILALALNKLLVSKLELSQVDPMYLAYGAVAFWMLGALTVLGPVIRAARIAPSIATRSV